MSEDQSEAPRAAKPPAPQDDEPKPKPVPAKWDGDDGHGEHSWDLREQRIVHHLEARLTKVLRREVMDPYAGLPADDVLVTLHSKFPEQNFPERMMRRLEKEQDARLESTKQQDETDRYVAETERLNAQEERALQKSWGARAERVVIILLVAGLLCLYTGQQAAGLTLLGTTLVGIATAFLMRRSDKK